MEQKRILFYTANTSAARQTAEIYAAQGHKVCIYRDTDQDHAEAYLRQGIDLVVLSLPAPEKDPLTEMRGAEGEERREETGAETKEGTELRLETEIRDYMQVLDVLCANTQPVLDFVEQVIPYLAGSPMKRIAYLTDRRYSVRETTDTDDFAIHMAGAANHMMMKILHNTYRSQGYTFRCFAWNPGDPGIPAWHYFLQNQSDIEIDPPCHSDENRLVLRDGMLREISW